MEFDEELLELAVDRQAALQALAEGPHHREELQEALSVSKSTSHRIVREFDEWDLIERDDSGYSLTLFGELLAAYSRQFEARVDAAAGMRPLLGQLDAADESIDPTLFVEPDIEWTVERSGSFSIDQGLERVRDTELLRVLDWTPVPDLYHERILRILAENEAKVESIYPEAEVEDRLERFSELHDELLEAGARPRYWVYEDVPQWGLSLYDDELLELRAYDADSGAHLLRAVSSASPAVSWGLDVFDRYRERARSLYEVESLPDWGDYTW